MPAFKPEPRTAAVNADFRSTDWHIYTQKMANGAERLFCRVTMRDASGHQRSPAFKFNTVECAENPKAKRAATKAVLARLLEMALAAELDGPVPAVVVPADEDEVVTP